MRISGLFIYPVKSCQGLALETAPIAATGFEHDRTWMVVDPKGLFITQRSHPAMARIATALEDGKLTLSSDGHGAISPQATDTTRSVKVWDDTSIAQDAGDEAAAWLAQVLETPARLVRCGGQWQRPLDKEGIVNPTTFADRYPFLVISEASLTDLNGHLASPVPMNRFRPNIVVTDTEAYAEDAAHTLTRDDVVIRIAKACERCTITTTDQTTGRRDPASEPLRSLARLRRNPEGRGVIFGRNAMLVSGAGSTLRIGDRFSVQAR